MMAVISPPIEVMISPSNGNLQVTFEPKNKMVSPWAKTTKCAINMVLPLI